MKIWQTLTDKWTKWFAWYPVTTENGDVLWLSMVERRLYWACIPNVNPPCWAIYRKEKKLEEE